MSNSATPAPGIDEIVRVWYAAYSSFALLAGCQLDVFTPLKDGPMSADQLAAALGVRSDQLSILLYALVPAGMLTVENGLFSNTPRADRFLVRGRPTYAGGAHTTYSLLFHAAMKTGETIRTGKPQAMHDYTRASEEEQPAMLRGLSASAGRLARELMQQRDFSLFHSVLDVGGGAGAFVGAVVEMHPQIAVTVAELPEVVPLARRLVAELPAGERVQVLPVDVTRDSPAGAYDAAVMLRFIQVLAPDAARRAIANVGRAVNPGGSLFIMGAVLDDSRLSPLDTVVLNPVFLSIYDGGRAYTEGEHRAWLAEAGFEVEQRFLLSAGFQVIAARKRAA